MSCFHRWNGISIPRSGTPWLTWRREPGGRRNIGARKQPPYWQDWCVREVPGRVKVPELGTVVRARLVSAEEQRLQGYNAGSLLDRGLLATELTVRNWRAGDRFFPAKTRSPKKLKELLQSGRVGQQLSLAQRQAWPVVESSGQIVWVRRWAVPEAFAMHAAKDGVLIEQRNLRL